MSVIEVEDVAVHTPRPEVAESLERCEALGIDAAIDPPFVGELARGARLVRAAEPVLDELRDLLHGVRVGVILADETVQVLETRFSDVELRRVFEERLGAAGFSWAEEHVGTSAVALAVKTRRPTYVHGAEHYRPVDQDMTAAAAPILDPVTQTVVGALDLSGPVASGSPHMLASVVQAARAIEQRLYDEASSHEHLLLARFLAERERTAGEAVFVVNERMVLSNTAGTSLLQAVDRSTLWEQALDTSSAIRATRTTNLLTLRDGRSLTASFERADPNSVRGGVLVRVAPAQSALAAPPRTTARLKPGATASGPVRYLDREIAESAAAAAGVLVTGEHGSGKLTAAGEIHHRSGRRHLAIADGAQDPIDGGANLVRDIAAAAQDTETTLVVRSVECLAPAALAVVRSALADPRSRGRIIATLSTEPHRPDSSLDDLFARRVHVPPLRERRDELPAIVGALMRRHGATGQMQPAAIEALGRHEWPGNIRELDATIKAVVASRRTCDITVRDLPPSVTVSHARRLTRMEHLERSAIQQALLEACGNRTQAAAILQIGRATLYRKMKSFGLAGPALDPAA